MKKIGFIGLGNMGKGMSINLSKKNLQIIGYDINKKTYDKLKNNNLLIADDLNHLMNESEIIITMLPDGSAVKKVWSEILGFSKGVTDFGTDEDKKYTVKFEGKAGMFLMHHAKIIHFADPNKSKTRSRRAFGFVYHGVSAKHDKQKEKMEQEQLKAELKSKNKL